jgi:5-methylthioadenosine/S-adenosylhomocysteine deaminase
MATLDGARTLGMQDHIGCLVPEKKADITVVAFDRIHLSPVYDPVSHLVYAARGSDVRHVVVNGKIVVREGRMVSVDEDELREQAQRKATEIGKELNMKIPLEVRRRDD